MLKGISALLSPELLATLTRMGQGYGIVAHKSPLILTTQSSYV